MRQPFEYELRRRNEVVIAVAAMGWLLFTVGFLLIGYFELWDAVVLVYGANFVLWSDSLGGAVRWPLEYREDAGVQLRAVPRHILSGAVLGRPISRGISMQVLTVPIASAGMGVMVLGAVGDASSGVIAVGVGLMTVFPVVSLLTIHQGRLVSMVRRLVARITG